ncbi:hypothetical protein Bpfe_027591, partial [Biomphalaria pfeifferi]
GPASLQAVWKRNDEDYPYPNNITNSNPSSSVVSGCNTYIYSSELKFYLEESDNGNTYICVVTEGNNERSRKMFTIEVISTVTLVLLFSMSNGKCDETRPFSIRTD